MSTELCKTDHEKTLQAEYSDKKCKGDHEETLQAQPMRTRPGDMFPHLGISQQPLPGKTLSARSR